MVSELAAAVDKVSEKRKVEAGGKRAKVNYLAKDVQDESLKGKYLQGKGW